MTKELLDFDNGLMIVRSTHQGVTDYTVMKEEQLTDTLKHIVPIFSCDEYQMAVDYATDYEL
mgnify:CR=1 FL=1